MKQIFTIFFVAFSTFVMAQTVAIQGGSSYPSIASAISAAVDGDVILVSGIHTESININKSIIIRGANPSTDIIQSALSPSTTGTGTRVINIGAISAASLNVSIENLTIRYGNFNANGGGINVDKVIGAVNLNNLIITDNFTTLNGGALSFTGSNVNMLNCTVQNNRSTLDGGGIIASPNNASGVSSIININQSIINANTGRNGGGIYINGNNGFGNNYKIDVNIENSTISNNTTTSAASGNGGGAIFTAVAYWTTNAGGDGVTGNISLRLIHATVFNNSHAAPLRAGIRFAGVAGALTNFSAYNSIVVANNDLNIKALNFQNANTTNVVNCILGGLENAPLTIVDDVNKNNQKGRTATQSGLTGMLSNLGGSTSVLDITSGSAADDFCSAITGVAIPSVDQRGFLRECASDAGAFEFGGNLSIYATTGTSYDIQSNAATAEGSISDICATFIEYGIEYSTSNNFLNGTGIQVVSNNINAGSFSSLITGLLPSTTYYYKSYATNLSGSIYGTQNSFTTSVDATTYSNGSWTNGIPTASVNTIIDDNFTTTVDLSVKSLTINSGKVFTVATGTTLTIVNALTNNAGLTGFVVESDGVVLQNSTVTNTALATVKRNSTPLFRQDYTVWSSPVFEPNLRNFSPQTLFNRFSTYDFSTSENGGYKQEINNNEEVLSKKFVNAKGYLIRMPNNANEVASGNAQTFVGEFKGVLNNGTITIPLYGNLPGTSNGLNLVGNPYPSPININTFFAENTQLTSGTMYFWRKKGSASDTNNSISGYATYNALGMVSADGTIQGQTLTHIKPGQGFFVKTTQASPADLVFNNTMRESTSSIFFKSSNETATELNRFWLNLSKEGTLVGQTLIGYTAGATQEVDSSFDAPYFNDAPLALTSLLNNAEYIIQGRALPFSSNDVVPLSFKTDVAGSFTISLSNFDGLFAETQDIFLKDKTTNTLQNLKTAAYTFTTPVGVFNNRFEVQYDSVLGTNNPSLATNNILIGVKNQQIKINAGTIQMEKIELIDISGRVLYSLEHVNSTSATIENIVSSNQMLIVRISTKENGVVNQKIIF